MRAASKTHSRAALRKKETRGMKIQQTVSAILLLQQGIEEAINKNYTGFAVLEKKVFELVRVNS